eukprot:Hpha_TRINITY_DN14437_c0_g1::TRINITY_DN14437_c0_g1_i1::g.157763::m.157763
MGACSSQPAAPPPPAPVVRPAAPRPASPAPSPSVRTKEAVYEEAVHKEAVCKEAVCKEAVYEEVRTEKSPPIPPRTPTIQLQSGQESPPIGSPTAGLTSSPTNLQQIWERQDEFPPIRSPTAGMTSLPPPTPPWAPAVNVNASMSGYGKMQCGSLPTEGSLARTPGKKSVAVRRFDKLELSTRPEVMVDMEQSDKTEAMVEMERSAGTEPRVDTDGTVAQNPNVRHETGSNACLSPWQPPRTEGGSIWTPRGSEGVWHPPTSVHLSMSLGSVPGISMRTGQSPTATSAAGSMPLDYFAKTAGGGEYGLKLQCATPAADKWRKQTQELQGTWEDEAGNAWRVTGRRAIVDIDGKHINYDLQEGRLAPGEPKTLGLECDGVFSTVVQRDWSNVCWSDGDVWQKVWDKGARVDVYYGREGWFKGTIVERDRKTGEYTVQYANKTTSSKILGAHMRDREIDPGDTVHLLPPKNARF